MLEAMQNSSAETRQLLETATSQFMELNVKSKATFFSELNKLADPGGIVFAGDSITEGYPLHEFFPSSLRLYNRGIGGVNSRQFLENLDSHVLGLSPRMVFLLIGTNDFPTGEKA